MSKRGGKRCSRRHPRNAPRSETQPSSARPDKAQRGHSHSASCKCATRLGPPDTCASFELLICGSPWGGSRLGDLFSRSTPDAVSTPAQISPAASIPDSPSSAKVPEERSSGPSPTEPPDSSDAIAAARLPWRCNCCCNGPSFKPSAGFRFMGPLPARGPVIGLGRFGAIFAESPGTSCRLAFIARLIALLSSVADPALNRATGLTARPGICGGATSNGQRRVSQNKGRPHVSIEQTPNGPTEPRPYPHIAPTGSSYQRDQSANTYLGCSLGWTIRRQSVGRWTASP